MWSYQGLLLCLGMSLQYGGNIADVALSHLFLSMYAWGLTLCVLFLRQRQHCNDVSVRWKKTLQEKGLIYRQKMQSHNMILWWPFLTPLRSVTSASDVTQDFCFLTHLRRLGLHYISQNTYGCMNAFTNLTLNYVRQISVGVAPLISLKSQQSSVKSGLTLTTNYPLTKTE